MKLFQYLITFATAVLITYGFFKLIGYYRSANKKFLKNIFTNNFI